MKSVLFSSLFVLCFTFISFSAHAGQPRLIGTYGDWLAYMFVENGDKVCYMASKPTKEEGNYSRRGDVFALVTHRPSEDTRDVFSYVAGYTYKPGSDVTVQANGETFELFTQDDRAWTSDAESDEKLVDAIRKGSRMVVKGVSSRGTNTTDTISLKGSSSAYKRITEECF